jgi:regulator of sigma E protease
MTLLLAIVSVGFLVWVHELGHFVVAKRMGVRVRAFSVGFGPPLLRVVRGETTYQLGAVPFGGFVQFDEAEPDGPPRDPRSFEAQTPGRRALIAVAGVATNILVAFLVLVALYGGYGLPGLEVVAVAAHSPAAQAGVRAGDVLWRLDGVNVAQTPGRIPQLVSAFRDRPLPVTLWRQGHTLTVRVVPRAMDGVVRMGVYLGPSQVFLGQGIGLGPRLAQAVRATGEDLGLLASGLVRLVTGQVPASQLGGPVRIVSMTSQVEAMGVPSALAWLALLSANLAVLNAVPFPGLDGGRLAFLLGEVLLRGRRNVRVEQAIHFIGLFLLMLFVGALTVQDLSRLHP